MPIHAYSCIFASQVNIINCMSEDPDIFEEEDDHSYNKGKNGNQFELADQFKNNINKRLPRGFTLVKLCDLPVDQPFEGDIDYLPGKAEIRVASEELAKQFVIQTQMPVLGGRRESRAEDKGLRFGQLPEGKSKQAEKIKNIIQRFRKHGKYSHFFQHLTRLGFANALNQIQNQNRKNIHTIDSFKERSLYLFQKALEVTYQPDKVVLINEMIDQIQFLVQNAQKAEFANSLGFVQKSIDKVTREISDIRETGSYYYRRKKRNQKNYDEKELLYIAELIHHLPDWEMVGILELIEEKPFSEITTPRLEFDLNTLKHKKVREIQFYTKKKLANYYRSRERKIIKMEIKGKVKEEKEKEKEENAVAKEEFEKREKQEDNGLFKGVQGVGNRDEMELVFGMEEEEAEREKEKLDYSESQQFLVPPSQPQDIDHQDLFGYGLSHSPSLSDIQPQFEKPDLLAPLQIKPVSTESLPEDLGSDSSYITDEQDSDF